MHLGAALWPVPPLHWFGKRSLGGLNLLLRRRHAYRGGARKLAALTRFVDAHDIDLVIMSGDYTSLGTEPEYRAARLAIEPLMAAAGDYVNVPGNHDLYMPEAVRSQRFERHFGDTLGSDLEEYRADGPWPLVRLVGEGVAVVAVNSARPNPQPWRSSGRVPAAQLEALSRVLADSRVCDRFVFVVTHYAPRLAEGRRDSRAHGLVNAEDLLAVCAGLETGAILCGHVHRRYRVRLPDVGPELFCAGSLTYEGREGFWLFSVENGALGVDGGRWDSSDGGRFVLEGGTVEVSA